MNIMYKNYLILKIITFLMIQNPYLIKMFLQFIMFFIMDIMDLKTIMQYVKIFLL